MRISRTLGALAQSESDTMLVCQGATFLDVPAGSRGVNVSWADIKATDEFNQIGGAFLTYSVRDILFDIYEQNPGLPAQGFWATTHTGGDAPATPAFIDVVDRPDAQAVAPGTGKTSLTWSAKTPGEKDFYSFNSAVDFGGLTAYLASSSAIVGKYLVVYKALVHFRGRR